MAKGKEAAKGFKDGEKGDVLEVVRSIGRDALQADGSQEERRKIVIETVRAAGQQQGVKFPQADGTLFQYVQAARSELGWTRARRSGGEPEAAGEPTISDLMRAKKFAAELGQTPAELVALVKKIQGFGSPATLLKCLEALETLQG